MAFFGVTKEIIDKIFAHPNADRLQLAKLKDMEFQFVIMKDEWKEGMEVLYFPIDSILPPEVITQLGLDGKLSGAQKNRVKTVKLRDEISQGIIGPLSMIDGLDLTSANGDKDEETKIITEKLGVLKYEPPEISCQTANLKRLPSNASVYDIEGADRYPRVVAALMDVPCWITEKMEGSNFSTSIEPDEVPENPSITYVNQHHHTIVEKEGYEHTWWKVAREQGLIEFAKAIQSKILPVQPLTIYGEMCGPGIQDNIYKFPTFRVFTFDIKIGENWLFPEEFLNLVETYYDKQWVAPTLSIGKTLREWLDGKTVQEASNGPSVFPGTIREGIVIKPMVPVNLHRFGRVILKQRSSEYLAKNNF